MNKHFLLVFAPVALIGCVEGSDTEPTPSPTATATATATDPVALPPTTDTRIPAAPTSGSPNADDERADRAPSPSAIPVRFHGKYAESFAQCDNSSHGRFTVRAKEIDFFESTGKVRSVRTEEDYAAVTVFEQHGDGPGSNYAFYIRLLPQGKLRYRYNNGERHTWVRC